MSDSLDTSGVISIRPVASERHAASDAGPPAALQFIAITFHPIRPIVYLATEHVIYVYDLSISGLLGHVRVGATERITHVLASATHPLMIAAIDSGSLYVWEQNTFSLIMVLQTAAKEALEHVQISMTQPVIYYTRASQREIGFVDLMKGPAIKLDLGRKGAQCLAVHPSKPEVACGCADGHVRFWDTAGKVSAGVDDFATMQTTANKNATVVGISQLAFDPLQHNLVAAASTGLTVIWSLGKTMRVLGSRRLVSGDLSLLSLHFHPRHALFYALTSNGVLSSWTYLKAAKDGNTIVSGTMAIGDLGAKEASARLAGTPSYLMPPTVLACNPISLRQHPKLNYTTFLYQPDFSFGGPAHLLQHAIYSLAEDNLSAFAPPVTSYNFPWRPELDEPVTFTYPAELYYFAKTNVLNAYLPAYAENILKKKIPEQDSEGIIVRPLRLAHNAHSDRFLILTVPNQQAISAQQLLTASHSGQLGLPPAPAATRVVLWHPSAPDSFSARAARDACWAVEGADLLLLLSEGGRRADLLPAAADRPLSATDLAEPAARVFTTPLPDGVVLYHVPESNALVYSANVAAQRTKEEPAYSLSRRPGDRLALQRDESVVQVNWHGSGLLFAVVTSHRTLLVARELTLLAQYVYPTNYTRPFCSSALWAGAALLMTTPTHLVYMTVEGAVRTVASLEQPGAVLLSVLNDKVVFAASNRTNTEIRAQPVGLLEPLVCGQLAYAAWRHTPAQELRVHLQRILARFDATRVSDNVYAALTAAGFPDAVASLLLVAPSPSLPHLYRAAVGSLRFDLALAIQRDRRGSDLPPPSELGRACIAYGQFDTARRVYELSNDFLALLQLYASCGNRPGVEQLLERAKKDEALKHHVPVVERILKVRTFGPSPTTLLPNWRIQSTMQEFDTTPVTAAAMLSAGKAAAADFIQPVGRLDTLDKHMAALHDRFAGKEPRGPAYLASAPEAVRPSAPATLPEPVVRAPPVRTVSERQVGAVISASGSAPPSPAGSGSSNSMASPSKESAVVITLASATNAATIPADFVARDKPDAARATAVDARANIIPSGELLTPLRPPPMARSLKATSSTLSIRRSPSDEDLARQADSDDDVPPNENDDDFSDDEGPEDGSSQSEPASPKRSSEAPASAPGTPTPTPGGAGSNPLATPGQLRDSPASSPAPSSVSSGSVPPSPLTLKRDSVSAAAAAHPALVAPPASALPPPMPPPPAALAASTGGSSDAVLERISSGSGSGIGSGIGSVLRVAQLSDDTLAAFEKDLTPDSGNPIRTSLLSGLSKLEKGNFAPALEDVEETIRQLADVPDNESNKMLMRLCVAYKLALKLLIEIKLLEKDPAGDRGKLAVYAKLLSDARLLPKHRVICARMAVNKNLEAGNYGVAARLLQTLLPLHLPDHASHETKLKKCEEEKLADGALPPPYTCPGCSTSVSVGASVCPTCGRTPYFCGLSWQILATKFCHGCVYCGALFHPDLLPLGTRCSYCNHGYVDKHSILH